MAAKRPARASPELREAPLSPRYRRKYTTSRDTALIGNRLCRPRRNGFGNCRLQTQRSMVLMQTPKAFASSSLVI